MTLIIIFLQRRIYGCLEIIFGACWPISSTLLLICSIVRFILILFITTISFVKKPSPKNESLLDSDLVNIGNALYQLSIIVQHVAVLYGLINFYREKRINDDIKGTLFLKYHCNQDDCVCYNGYRDNCERCTNDNCKYCIFITRICGCICVIGTGILIYVLVLLVAPVLLSVWLGYYVLWFDESHTKVIAGVYVEMAWIQYYGGNAWIRFMMGIVVTAVVRKWSSEQSQLNDIDDFTELVKNYKSTGKVTSTLSNIFRKWFVCQWLTFFIEIAGESTLFFKSILDEKYKDEPHRLSYNISVHLIYDIVSFMIPYFLGILINTYHKKYHDCLKERQEVILKRDSCNISNTFLIYADLIPKNPKFEFIPSLLGLQIPLDSAGYMLTILIAIFSFIATLLVTFADLNKNE